MFKPRPNQEKILEYRSGKMGISAVPGSGKTHTLSYLAAQLIADGKVADDQEILVVTLVNSAVDNFSSRIAKFVQEAGLFENVGYRVRTLHGLGHDIILERPDLAGLSGQFSIIDEIESYRMVEQLSVAYTRIHPEVVDYLLRPDVEFTSINHSHSGWSEMIASLNQNFISQAKDMLLAPDEIQNLSQRLGYTDVLLEIALEVYYQYERGLRYRNALDFADLIRLAYQVLQSEPEYLKRLQYRWPYILEDEAQDSSNIQEKLLRLLVGESGNWVRVGDPNQAIYETFTTADPKYLRDFLKEDGVLPMSLPHSGRSNQSIMDLANSLIEWTMNSHPVPELRAALDLPLIAPAPPGDPQPNPSDHPHSVYIRDAKTDSQQEKRVVIDNVKKWLQSNQDKTVAVLCPIGKYGEEVATELQKADIPIVEMLKSSHVTRSIAEILRTVLLSLSAPSDAKQFSKALLPILNHVDADPERIAEHARLAGLIQKCKRIEDFFYPPTGHAWSECLEDYNEADQYFSLLDEIRQKFIRWHGASTLPIDQLILTISRDLFTSPAEIALVHKFALLLEFSSRLHPEYDLTNLAGTLSEISSNHKKFSGFSDEELRFNPDSHKGKVFVSTYHKAKGMEWDRVYLMSVNNYDFPSAQSFDSYISERWFIRENFNPEAELLSKLTELSKSNASLPLLPPGAATGQARLKYASERLRLFFVGITRARESLVITWNTGRNKDRQMSLPLEALNAIWRGEHATSG